MFRLSEMPLRCTPAGMQAELTAISGKVLITGATGFIGSHLVERVLELGGQVIVIRRPSSSAPRTRAGVTYVELDYADKAAVTNAMRVHKPNYILHVAGVTKGVRYQDYADGNVMPAAHLIEAIHTWQRESPKDEFRRFVLVSSLAAYGPSSAERPMTEERERNPIEFYGKSKKEVEVLLETQARFAWTIVRPAGVYGPKDADYFNLFREIENGRNVFFGNQHHWFSCVYVDDCVDAILHAALSEKTRNRGYFICDDTPVTWGRFQDAIIRAAEKRVFTLHLPQFFVNIAGYAGELATQLDGKPRLFNQQRVVMNAQEAWTCTSRALSHDTGYRAEIDVDEGVKRAVLWYRKEKWM